MQDYAKILIDAINQYDFENNETINHLRDVVCWYSENSEIKKDPVIAELLYVASQKMRVFGYNKLNGFKNDLAIDTGSINDIGDKAIQSLYISNCDNNVTLDKSQKEVIDLFQSISPKRLLVSAPTSYGKTFLMREIVFLNKARYNNILLVFPTVSLLLENAGVMSWFVKKHGLNYRIVKTVDDNCKQDDNKIFVFTPERALQLLASFPNLKIDFFFFDEVYKIDEDYCNDEMDEKCGNQTIRKVPRQANSFLDEDRGKTFRIALYLLSKTVDEYYLAGPNLSLDNFGLGMRRFLEYNKITVKEISFEPTLRITVDAFSTKLKEKTPLELPPKDKTALVSIGKTINEKIKCIVDYIDSNNYGQTLLYCKSPAKAIEYSKRLSDFVENNNSYENYPEDFKIFIEHIRNEYNVENYVDEWCLVKVLKNGFGMHHGKLPKYIQSEILEQFNNRLFKLLFCTSTIVEGVNTGARNMVILNASKGRQKLSPFDIKNIKGRAGRYHHCFVGRVFYLNKELLNIENSGELKLDFVTYSNKKLNNIDLDNAEYQDLTDFNKFNKKERDKETFNFQLPEYVYIKNRTISKEYQERLLQELLQDNVYDKYRKFITYNVDVESFLKYRWINKIMNTLYMAGLIDKVAMNKYSAIANSYYDYGFKGILGYEISQYKRNEIKDIDEAYNRAFNSLRGILEHRIPKILSLFESIITYVAVQNGDDVSTFSLSRVRRYYETGVKSLMGEALIEYGFPTDAIRRIEGRYSSICYMNLTEAKKYCRKNLRLISMLLDSYEKHLLEKALSTI